LGTGSARPMKARALSMKVIGGTIRWVAIEGGSGDYDPAL
jgi:hypothetical protein